MEEKKDIMVTNLASKLISPKPGQNWRAFTVYQIQGNDGVRYETTDQEFFNSLAIGKTVPITFKTETKTVNGKVYTSYRLVLPKKADLAMQELEQRIMNRIELAEKNIIAAIKIIPAKAEELLDVEDPNQLSLFGEEAEDATGDPNEKEY